MAANIKDNVTSVQIKAEHLLALEERWRTTVVPYVMYYLMVIFYVQLLDAYKMCGIVVVV